MGNTSFCIVMAQSSDTHLYCIPKQIEISKQMQLSYVAHLCNINDLAKIWDYNINQTKNTRQNSKRYNAVGFNASLWFSLAKSTVQQYWQTIIIIVWRCWAALVDIAGKCMADKMVECLNLLEIFNTATLLTNRKYFILNVCWETLL